MARKLWNIDTAKQECIKLGVELLSEDYSGVEKLLFKCKCGNQFQKLFSNILLGQNHCPECGMKKKEIFNLEKRQNSFNELLEYMDTNMKDFKLLTTIEEYKNNKTKLKVVCSCGNTFSPNALNIKRGLSTRCRKCSSKEVGLNSRVDYTDVEKFVLTQNYKLLSRDVKNSISWIQVTCENDSHGDYWTSWGNFRSGNRCPKCNLSKGEQKVREFLLKNNIDFQEEFKIDGLEGINGGSLRFDFCVNIVDKIVFIEYDGEQHFKPKFGDYEFHRTIYNDKVKNEYCLKNKLKLIRIPYTEFDNIENILSYELNMPIPR